VQLKIRIRLFALESLPYVLHRDFWKLDVGFRRPCGQVGCIVEKPFGKPCAAFRVAEKFFLPFSVGLAIGAGNLSLGFQGNHPYFAVICFNSL
jgi:hypothetical protein